MGSGGIFIGLSVQIACFVYKWANWNRRNTGDTTQCSMKYVKIPVQ